LTTAGRGRAIAAATELSAVRKASCTASLTVLKWTTSCFGIAASSKATGRSTAIIIATRSRSQRAVLPSMSLKRKVTVPEGRSGMIGL
jgi:hypothetical protein